MGERYRMAGALASPLFMGGIAASYTSGQWFSIGLPVLLVGLFLWFSPEIFEWVYRKEPKP